MITFGILGCGMIANIHADAIKGISGARLEGVADANEENALRFAARYGVKAYSSYEEMLADKEIDAVCICTPSFLHAENAISALLAGKHVALEKPMALDIAQAKKIAKTCEETGKKLTVISQFRFSEDLRRVKRLIGEGAFGKITLCDLRMKYYRSEEYFTSSTWHGRLACEGGGALMNQGIHGIDILLYLCGDVKKVRGEIRTLSHNIEVEDTAAAVVEFESGALGTIEASTCAYPGFSRTIEICGDKGYVFLRENRIEKMLTASGEKVENPIPESGSSANAAALECDMHGAQLKNLIGAINGEEKLLIDCYDGMKAVALIRKIYGYDE